MQQPDQTILVPVQTQKALLDAVLCGSAITAFAYLVIFPFPLKTIALIPLVAAAFIIARNLNWPLISWKFLQRQTFSKKLFLYNLTALLMGIAGAMYYRGSFDMPVFPGIMRSFAIVAVAIGITEELLFRGFLQGRLSEWHPGFAIAFAAFAHTTYKVLLFFSPASQHLPFNTKFYIFTFVVYILIGLLRYFSKSILPAIVVHAVFDLLVYGENIQAPWWVW